jgi:uncharacterized membrane protein
MSPVVRRAVHALLFEAVGVVLVSLGLTLFSGHAVVDTGLFAVASSVVAMAWNYVFNTLFERWEARQTVRGRGVLRRAVHAVGFELGLTVLLVPLLAWWLDLSLLEALLYDLTLVLFFVVYSYLFNLGFDHVFGLPESARPRAGKSSERA